MKNIVIIGASINTDFVTDIIEKDSNYDLIGYVDSFWKKGRIHNGHTILGNEYDLPYLMDKHKLYGGIVTIKDSSKRKTLVDRILSIIPNFNFISSVSSDIDVNVDFFRNSSNLVSTNQVKGPLNINKLTKSIMVHHLADVQTQNIGDSTKVWQYSVILKNAKIGDNCNINSHTFIENDVILGDNVTIKCGVYLWDGTRIQDDVFIGPNVTFSNDKYPRSKKYPSKFQSIHIKKGASIGANSTLLGGICIGANSLIGAGSVVSKNVPDGELWVGNPARFVRKID